MVTVFFRLHDRDWQVWPISPLFDYRTKSRIHQISCCISRNCFRKLNIAGIWLKLMWANLSLDMWICWIIYYAHSYSTHPS